MPNCLLYGEPNHPDTTVMQVGPYAGNHQHDVNWSRCVCSLYLAFVDT